MSSIIVISVNKNNWAYQKMIQSKAILIDISSKVIKNKIIFELEIERLRDFMKI